MKNKIIAIWLCVLLVIGAVPMSVFALNTEDVVILYENDVHCTIEGYSKLAAMKKELQGTHAHVGVVSGGDYIQGNSLGVISQGEYVVQLMNLVGYDAVALGNHEFDYHMGRLEELIGMMDTKPICCNFQKIGEDTPYFKPYSIVSYGGVDVAYIGITTPSTLTTSAPNQFKDDDGNFLYTFHSTDLYAVVQSNIDAAKAEGADYIIAVSHVGYADDDIYGNIEDVENLIMNTNGFDVVLDAHSHTVIEGMKITDKGGNDVLLSSTGTKFANIGKLTLSEDGCETQLIKTEEYQNTDAAVDAYIQQIYSEYATLGERKVASGQIDLIVNDENGNRLVRKYETNLGDLAADSFRYALNADIGYINGGGLRASISKGDITLNDLLNVLPFNNSVVLAELSGQTIKDMMEMAMMVWPEENGAFPHVSGLTFSVNTAIPSSVVLNEFEEFDHVSGEYRVYDLRVYNRESGEYEPIDLSKTYTFAASNYYLLECGSGMKMLEHAKIIQNDGILDVETLERYILEQLGGTVGQEYAEVKANITFTNGIIVDTPVIDEPEELPEEETSATDEPEELPEEETSATDEPEELPEEETSATDEPEELPEEETSATDEPEELPEEETSATDEPEELPEEETSATDEPESVPEVEAPETDESDEVPEGETSATDEPEKIPDSDAPVIDAPETEVPKTDVQENDDVDNDVPKDDVGNNDTPENDTEKPVEAPGNDAEGNDVPDEEKVDIPQTGSDSLTVVWLLAMISGALLIGMKTIALKKR